MGSLSIWPILAALSVAFFVNFILVKRFGAPAEEGRFVSIDGLRGYLAFFVFLHHSSVWYFYLRTGQWTLPPSNLYTHLGQASVGLFFMITSFLFFSKILDSRVKGIDWFRMYVGRFLRIAPLYAFLMLLVFVVVALLTGGRLREPFPDLCIDVVRWLGFTAFGAPDLNGLDRTFIIVSGVTWSLACEWIFYLSLPIISLFVGRVPPVRYVLLSIAIVVLALLKYPSLSYMSIFVSGMAVAVLARDKRCVMLASTKVASFIAIGCVLLGIVLYPTAYKLVPLGLLTVAFGIIACGNNLFGILSHPVSRHFGELAYGIYLFHGIVLFVIFNFVVGIPVLKGLSPEVYWLIVLAAAPVLILISFMTFHLIERPGMRSSERVTTYLRQGWRKLAVPGAAVNS